MCSIIDFFSFCQLYCRNMNGPLGMIDDECMVVNIHTECYMTINLMIFNAAPPYQKDMTDVVWMAECSLFSLLDYILHV
jgi:hypothetical protein